jgi:glycosyltransferase involved in cell wall biosynthesis
MKIIILTASPNVKYGGGMDRVIHNARVELDKNFDTVLYLSGRDFFTLLKGVLKIIKNNPFSFTYIIFNSLASVRKRYNKYWKLYFYLCKMCMIKPVFYWHEMPEYYLNFKKSNPSEANEIEAVFKNKNSIQLGCSEENIKSGFYFDDNPNIKNINNCINPKEYRENFLLSNFTVITVGSIQTIKGTDIWTEVAIKVCQKNRDIQFVWCGGVVDKTLYNECINKIKEANLESQITFLGHVEDASIIASAAHLYYCSSRLDSFPLSILEAMSQGKNILYYDSGGVVEAVGKNGIYIPDFSVNQTVEIIQNKYDEFKLNPKKVFNKNLFNRFYENYTPEIFVNKLKNALQRN